MADALRSLRSDLCGATFTEPQLKHRP